MCFSQEKLALSIKLETLCPETSFLSVGAKGAASVITAATEIAIINFGSGPWPLKAAKSPGQPQNVSVGWSETEFSYKN